MAIRNCCIHIQIYLSEMEYGNLLLFDSLPSLFIASKVRKNLSKMFNLIIERQSFIKIDKLFAQSIFDTLYKTSNNE